MKVFANTNYMSWIVQLEKEQSTMKTTLNFAFVQSRLFLVTLQYQETAFLTSKPRQNSNLYMSKTDDIIEILSQ
jgi:hypothetical protein